MSILSNAERFSQLIKRNLWGIGLGGACLFAVMRIVLGGGAEASAPPAELTPCAEQSEITQLICNTPKLAALQSDMAQAAVRAAGYYRFSVDAQRELERLTPQLVGMRTVAAGSDGVGLERVMRHQSAFLNALAKPRSGEAGRWVNALGEVQITETTAGYAIAFKAVEPARNEWRCETTMRADRELFGLRSTSGAENAALQGWTLRLHREGAMLRVEEIAPDGAATNVRPYCFNGGGLAGAYFPAL